MDPVEQVEHDDGDRELVAGLGRQQGGVATLGVLADQRVRRSGHDQLAAAAYGLRDAGSRARVVAFGGQHHDEVEAAGPAGQAGAGPGDERHRADRLEHRAQQAGVGTGSDDRARLAVGEPLHGLADRLLRGHRLPTHPGPALGQVAQAYVGPRQRGLVVEEPVVEGHRV